MDCPSLDKILLDTMKNIVSKLASSKTDAETEELQALSQEVIEAIKLTDPAAKKAAWEKLESRCPKGCGCS